MKILSESEIKKLYSEMMTKAESLLDQMKEREHDNFLLHQDALERQYQRELRIYEQALKIYESKVANEEAAYPKRLENWENQEELRKRLIEQNYRQSVATYEKMKLQHETAGLPFNVPYPKKMTFTPHPKPHKKVFNKPTPPAPRKPENETFLRSINFLCDLHAMDFLSESAIHKLSKIDISTSEGKDRACQIISRELYLDKRIDMECSHSEGYGVSPVLDGLFGEKLTVFELELCVHAGFKGTILHNLEIVIKNRTIQIDILFITQKGIFVIESKNYSGSISGAEHQNKWTLRTRKKDYHFYNPVLQNQAHINILSKIANTSNFFSLIAFSERCHLDYIDIHTPNVFVFNRYALRDVISDVFSNEPDVFSEADIASVTEFLRRYCADDPAMNPNYKETRNYFSAYSKSDSRSNSSYHDQYRRRAYGKEPFSYNYGSDNEYDDDFDDYDDCDY